MKKLLCAALVLATIAFAAEHPDFSSKLRLPRITRRVSKEGTVHAWLYLAGEAAAKIARCLSSGPIEVGVLAGGVGRPSALCLAGRLDVIDDLDRQWARSGPSLPDLEREISRAAPKAWRFTGEMHEIAATFQSAGMAAEFRQAAPRSFVVRKCSRDLRSPI